MTQVVLMAGGKGTRLQPFTLVLPKPLVPIGENSIIEMVLRQLRYFGFQRVKISVGHKAELIMAVVGNGKRYGLDVGYFQEQKPLGTVGAIAELTDLDDNFLVMNGDICTNMNFRSIYDFHIAHNSVATIGTYRRHEKIELGVLEFDDSSHRITGFREKPSYDFTVCMGVNVFHKSIVELIPRGECFGFDMLMLKMLQKKIHVRSYLFEGLWLDIGRPDDYNKMVQEFQQNPRAYLPEGA